MHHLMGLCKKINGVCAVRVIEETIYAKSVLWKKAEHSKGEIKETSEVLKVEYHEPK